MRPNINIEDMAGSYLWLLDHPELQGVYNVGWENLTAMETARLIAKHIPCDIVITKVKDKRSYAVDSNKFWHTGFRKMYTVEDAIKNMQRIYKVYGMKKTDQSINLHWMRQLGVAA